MDSHIFKLANGDEITVSLSAPAGEPANYRLRIKATGGYLIVRSGLPHAMTVTTEQALVAEHAAKQEANAKEAADRVIWNDFTRQLNEPSS